MTAIACMRILVSEGLGPGRASALAELVDKVVNAFLQTRWAWPRQFSALAPFTFALTDPSRLEIEVGELQALSMDLHVKLFGSEGQGRVVLLAFEGERSEVLRFAEAAPDELRAVLAGAAPPKFRGKISLISPDGVEPLEHAEVAATLRTPSPDAGPTPEHRFSGVYFLSRQAFVGSALTTRGCDGRAFVDITQAERDFSKADALEFDLRCLRAAPAALARMAAGTLYVSLSFSSIMHRAARTSCESLIANLPRGDRARLAATLRGVPRDPSTFALAQIREILSPAFSIVDLHVTDPYFEVGRLASEAVSSVTLVLPNGEDHLRLAAARHFMKARDEYRAKRIWPAVTDVRTRGELAGCARLRVPFVSGKAVCGLMLAPVPPRPFPLDALPYREQALEGIA